METDGFRCGLIGRHERLAGAVDQRRGRHVDAAGNAAGPAVAARFESFVELRTERVDDHGRAVGARLLRLTLVDEEAGLWLRGEFRRRIALCGSGFDGA